MWAFFYVIHVLTSHLCACVQIKTMSHLWVQHSGVSVLFTKGHSDQLADCTAKEMKSNSLQLAGVVLMEPFKSRIAPVSENMANTLADVISQLLPQSEQVPPRLSESQCDAFHLTRSCSIKYGELFEAPCLCWYSCDPAANYQVSKGLLVKKSRAQSAHA